jgi:L-lysine exporter family protein LysE/ArgO
MSFLSASAAAAYSSGFVTAAGLFVAIGAQNAFVLRQGLLRQHVGPIVVFCTLSDFVLLTLGVLGLTALIVAFPWLQDVVRWFGVAFILWFGSVAARRALRPAQSGPVPLVGEGAASRRAAILSAAAFTWLNPHVWLDSMLVGTIANGFGADRYWFAVGTMTVSAVWFILLGYGARFLAPAFKKPMAWRVLDGSIAVMMTAIAGMLALGGL